MSPSRGQRIGPYEILSALGAGGMGDVYRAHDARLGRDIALKVLPPDVASDPERLERFRREARAVAALNHPHIVTIFSIEEDHGVPFMTMELIEGQSLDRLVSPGGLALGRFFDIGIAARGRTVGGASQGPGPSRREACQRDDDRRRRRQSARLRTGARGGSGAGRRRGDAAGPDPSGDHRRHRAVHVAGADRGEAGGSPERHLLGRCRALRDAGRREAVQRRIVAGADVVDPERSTAAAHRGAPRCARRRLADSWRAAWRSRRAIAIAERAGVAHRAESAPPRLGIGHAHTSAGRVRQWRASRIERCARCGAAVHEPRQRRCRSAG